MNKEDQTTEKAFLAGANGALDSVVMMLNKFRGETGIEEIEVREVIELIELVRPIVALSVEVGNQLLDLIKEVVDVDGE